MKKEPELSLPKYEVNETVSSLSQKIDWGLKQLNVPDTWKVTRGEGITVMVIDTGHPNHPDLNDNTKPGRNFIDGESMFDDNGHQTHCTGIICAQDNAHGMVGVAPESNCLSVKALSRSGSGSYAGLAAALDYAIEVQPDLVSMSLGGSMPSTEMESRIKKLYAMNIPVICAAGNTGEGGVNWPAAYDETIAVAAYDKFGEIAYFSSRGDTVEWAAPGVDIYSTYLNGTYASLSGTSMACPFIAGVIALMLSKHKKQEEATGMNDCKTVEDIRNHLLKYTKDKGESGKDNSWGYGTIDVKGLILNDPVEEEDPFTPPQPEPEPEEDPEEDPFTPPQPEPEPEPEPEPDPKCPLPNPCPEAPCPDYPNCKPEPEPEKPNEDCPFQDPCPWPNPCPPCPEYPEKIEPPKKDKNKLYMILGIGFVVVSALIIYMFTTEDSFEIPNPPYIDENGNVNWDDKYEHDRSGK